jgi:6,7-dimethyl-8-ribityllumazine synthase
MAMRTREEGTMAKVFEGNLKADGKRFGLVVSRFNELVSKRLLDGALDCLLRHGAKDEDLKIVWVPGGFEVPLAAKKLVQKGGLDAVVCLGAIIRGNTPHFEYVASMVARGISTVTLEHGVPATFGIITADSLEQAMERAGAKAGNKGWFAALTAIEMAQLMEQLGAEA